MSYFNTQMRPLAGSSDILKGGTTDFQSLLNASLFDLGTASNSDLTQTTAAPATGPSSSVQSSAEASDDLLTLNGIPLGKASDATFNDRLNVGLAQAILEKDNPDRDDRRLRNFQQMMRQEAIFADEMGRKNYDKALLGSMIQKIPEAITNMAMAGTVYNAQNAVGPYNAAQYGRKYFT